MPVLMISQYNCGHGELFLEDNPPLRVLSPACMLVMPGVRHCIEQYKTGVLARWVHVNFYLRGNSDLFWYYQLPPLITGRQGRAIGDRIEEWHHLAPMLPSEPSLLRRVKEAEFGMQLLELLCPHLRPRAAAVQWPADKARQHAMEMIRPALDLLERDYARPLTRDELAATVSFSSAQFHRVFLKATGITPMEYRMNLRLRRAQLLLMTTELAIKEVARQIGYEDQFVFSKAFKLRFGQSPQAYRTAMARQRL